MTKYPVTLVTVLPTPSDTTTTTTTLTTSGLEQIVDLLQKLVESGDVGVVTNNTVQHATSSESAHDKDVPNSESSPSKDGPSDESTFCGILNWDNFNAFQKRYRNMLKFMVPGSLVPIIYTKIVLALDKGASEEDIRRTLMNDVIDDTLVVDKVILGAMVAAKTTGFGFN